MKKMWEKVKNALYNYFVRCGMNDEEWEAYLDAKRHPVWLGYRDGCECLYKNKDDKQPFRMIRNGEIVWEQT